MLPAFSNQMFREPVNGLTHAAGALLSSVGAVLLISAAANEGKTVHIIAFAVFCAGLIALYSASALYHLLRVQDATLQLLRKIDHTMIFVLIAGTYTPVCLVALRNNWGVPLLVLIWSIAIAGIVFTLFWLHAPRWLYTSIYIIMGWLGVAAIVPLVQSLSGEGLFWLFAGGAFYTAGAIIYGMKKPDPLPGTFGFHEIWHLFVMAGSFCHFMLMYRAILPLPNIPEGS